MIKKSVLIFLWLGFFGTLHAEQTKTIFNPFTGKLDYITKVDSTTLPGGSTQYIQNVYDTGTHQTPAALYIDSATIQGPIQVYSASNSSLRFTPNSSTPVLSLDSQSIPSLYSGITGSWLGNLVWEIFGNASQATDRWSVYVSSLTNGSNDYINPRYQIGRANGTHYFNDVRGNSMLTIQGEGANGTSLTLGAANGLGSYGLPIGVNLGSYATNSVLLGTGGSSASTNGAIAIGYDAQSTNGFSIAMGVQTAASGQHAIAIGNGAIASGGRAVAIGYQSLASHSASCVVGLGAQSFADYETLFGHFNSFSVGYGLRVTGVSTTQRRSIFNLSGTFTDATDATFKSKVGLAVQDSGSSVTGRTAQTWETDGTNPFTTVLGSMTVQAGTSIQGSKDEVQLNVWAKQGQTANLLTVSTVPASVGSNDFNSFSVTPQGDLNIPYSRGIYWLKSNGGQPKILNTGNGSMEIWANPVLGFANIGMATGIQLKGATNVGDENPANAPLQFNTSGFFGTNYGRPFLFSFGHDGVFTFGVRNNGTYTFLSTNTASGSTGFSLFEMIPSFVDDSSTKGKMILNTCHGSFGGVVDEPAVTMQSNGLNSLTVIGSSITDSSSTFKVTGSTNTKYDVSIGTTDTNGSYHVSVSTNGHIIYGVSAATVTSCGTTPGLSGSDNAGTITVGGGITVTACTLGFARSWGATPTCVFSDDSTALTGDISSISATAATFSFSASLAGGHIYYLCSCIGASCQ